MAAAPTAAVVDASGVVVGEDCGRLRRRKSRILMRVGYQFLQDERLRASGAHESFEHRCLLLGVVYGARLADDRDLDLAWVLELLLDVARDGAAEEDRGVVVYGVGRE